MDRPKEPDAGPHVRFCERRGGAIHRAYSTETISLDLAYTHVFVDNAPIDRSESGVRFIGSADTSVDIVSASLKMKFGGAEPAPLK